MGEVIAVWTFLQQAGQVSVIGVLIALLFIKWNDLRHLARGLEKVEKMILAHLEWHSRNP